MSSTELHLIQLLKWKPVDSVLLVHQWSFNLHTYGWCTFVVETCPLLLKVPLRFLDSFSKLKMCSEGSEGLTRSSRFKQDFSQQHLDLGGREVRCVSEGTCGSRLGTSSHLQHWSPYLSWFILKKSTTAGLQLPTARGWMQRSRVILRDAVWCFVVWEAGKEVVHFEVSQGVMRPKWLNSETVNFHSSVSMTLTNPTLHWRSDMMTMWSIHIDSGYAIISSL